MRSNVVASVLALAGALVACSGGDGQGELPGPVGPRAATAAGAADDDAGAAPSAETDGASSSAPAGDVDTDGDGVADAKDDCPIEPDASQADRDHDGVGDACDCAPDDAKLAAYRLVVDSLGADDGAVAVAPSFPAADWAFAGGAYVQSRLASGTDATFATVGGPLEDVYVEVTGVSTQVAEPHTLRQIAIAAGASAEGSRLAAKACAIEVTATGQTVSVVSLSGASGDVTSTAIADVSRPVLPVGQEFTLKMTSRAGSVTCTVVYGDGTSYSATAAGVAGLSGAVGLVTRETKASFKNLKICAFPRRA